MAWCASVSRPSTPSWSPGSLTAAEVSKNTESGRHRLKHRQSGQAVKLDRVAGDDLVAILGRHSGEIILDVLARIGEGRVGMRIIRRPHQVVHPDDVADRHADLVFDKGG